MRQAGLVAFNLLMVICAFFIGFLVWTYLSAIRPAIDYVDTPTQQQSVCSGEMFKLCRNMSFTRDVDLSISRSLVKQNENGSTDTVHLNVLSVQRKAGSLSQCRDIYTPYGISEGDYKLHTYITLHEFPFWNIRSEAPTVDMHVVGVCNSNLSTN